MLLQLHGILHDLCAEPFTAYLTRRERPGAALDIALAVHAQGDNMHRMYYIRRYRVKAQQEKT